MSETTGIDWLHEALHNTAGASDIALEMTRHGRHAVCEWAAQIALSRHASGVTEEREWISVERVDVEDGTDCWIRWIAPNGSVQYSLFDGDRNHGLQFPYVVGATHYAVYQKPTPPPFSQHGQSDE